MEDDRQRSSERLLLETTIIARVNDLLQFMHDQMCSLRYGPNFINFDVFGQLRPFYLPRPGARWGGSEHVVDEVHDLAEKFLESACLNAWRKAVACFHVLAEWGGQKECCRNLREFAISDPLRAFESIAAIRELFHSLRVARDNLFMGLDAITATAHSVKTTPAPHAASLDPHYANKIESIITSLKDKIAQTDPTARCLQRLGELEVFMKQYFGIAETSVPPRPLTMSQVPMSTGKVSFKPFNKQTTHSQPTSTGIPFDTVANQTTGFNTTANSTGGVRKTQRKRRFH